MFCSNSKNALPSSFCFHIKMQYPNTPRKHYPEKTLPEKRTPVTQKDTTVYPGKRSPLRGQKQSLYVVILCVFLILCIFFILFLNKGGYLVPRRDTFQRCKGMAIFCTSKKYPQKEDHLYPFPFGWFFFWDKVFSG